MLKPPPFHRLLVGRPSFGVQMWERTDKTGWPPLAPLSAFPASSETLPPSPFHQFWMARGGRYPKTIAVIPRPSSPWSSSVHSRRFIPDLDPPTSHPDLSRGFPSLQPGARLSLTSS